VTHDTPHTTYLSLRIGAQLAADLKRVAREESNTQSSVARRLIALGLKRELRKDPMHHDSREDGRG
jgi:hypothetical protein